ncbi:MAG: hypothetical protein IKJ20_05660 [Alistipes sp.]|nr:hypothetical protein [Alistipes sp.]
MSATLIFWLSFIILIGLYLCIPERISDANGSYEDNLAEIVWTDNYALRKFYGISNLIGILLVITSVGYLTFAEHWWYIFVYMGAIIGAKIGAFLLKLGIVLICDPLYMYDRLKICRIVGSLIVCAVIVISIIALVI